MRKDVISMDMVGKQFYTYRIERETLSEQIFFICNLSLNTKKYKEKDMSQNENVTDNEKKEISGIWVLVLFAVLFAGIILLGWLCK